MKSQPQKSFFVSDLTTIQIIARSKKEKCRQKNASHNSTLKGFHTHFKNCRFQVIKTKEQIINEI